MAKVLIIGSGPGGYESAIRARQNGLEAVLFESRDLGGTCLNRGCIPTKALLHAAELYSSDKEAAKWGISFENKSVDITKVYEKKDQIVQTLRKGIEQLLKANGVELIRAHAQVVSEHTVIADDKEFTGDYIILAGGSEVSLPPIPGLSISNRIVTSDELLARAPLGKKVVVLGGGVIGVEMTTFLSAFGYEIEIIEAMPRLLPEMDEEFGKSLQMNFKKSGIKVNVNAKATAIREENDSVIITLESGEVVCDTLLVCTGRRANQANLFSESAKAPNSIRGRFTVNEHGETDIKGIFAIGDITTGVQLAHAASTQGKAVIDYIAGIEPECSADIIPGCVYTTPEIASVGLTLQKALEANYDAEAYKYLMSGNGRTIISDTGRGFVKVVVDKSTDKILGAQLMCDRASDTIDEFTMAIANNLSYKDMLKGMRPHPTFVEGVQEALESIESRAIHVAPKRK